MLNQQYAILTVIDSYIEPLLIPVISSDKLGVCCGTIQIDSVSSSCGKAQGDRFKLTIPYVKQNLTWNVFFDSQCPEMGPDFIFNDNTFLADMDIDTLSTKVPSLAKWNPNDHNALLNVLVELLACYKQHQIQLLQKQTRLQIEYHMLMESTEMKQENVEMILLPFSSKPTEAKFLINLTVDLSKLQTRTCNSETDTAMLLVVFSGTDWNRIIPQLYFSKSLEEILGRTDTLSIPPFPPDQYLLNYVQRIKKYISDKINSVVQKLERKREYLAAFVSLKRNCSLEFDAINSSYMSALLSENDFYFVLNIQLPLEFPYEPPLVSMISVYHMVSQNNPYTEIVQNYPYDSAWKPSHMINELLRFVKQNVKKFQCNSCRICTL
ncbi:unnamed protein product [Xylocopa violacea]|uniref:BRISC and BRCA1-A complex member 2 n=1 Tax=Xylocopa violacea TaxID=135666 RepID=A0ABP1N0B8_XYLVO